MTLGLQHLQADDTGYAHGVTDLPSWVLDFSTKLELVFSISPSTSSNSVRYKGGPSRHRVHPDLPKGIRLGDVVADCTVSTSRMCSGRSQAATRSSTLRILLVMRQVTISLWELLLGRLGEILIFVD